MKNKGISYTLLDLYLLPRFTSVYRQAFNEVEGKSMTPEHLSNWMRNALEKIKIQEHPDHFYFCAMRSKKIVGIVIMIPQYELDGIMRAFIDTFYIIPEYRKYTHIAETMAETMVDWAKRRKFKTLLVLDNPNSNKWERKKRVCKFKPFKKVLAWDLEEVKTDA